MIEPSNTDIGTCPETVQRYITDLQDALDQSEKEQKHQFILGVIKQRTFTTELKIRNKVKTMDNSPWHFTVGETVQKPKGYFFAGIVVARFLTTQGKERYVVEHNQSVGMLHIFSPQQLERITENDQTVDLKRR